MCFLSSFAIIFLWSTSWLLWFDYILPCVCDLVFALDNEFDPYCGDGLNCVTVESREEF